MFIKRIHIRNFKSLRDVQIEPEGLATLVGPNGAGKTNFASAIRFLTEVYGHGLEAAIARAGGFENIALRRIRRSTSPIWFEVEVVLPADGDWLADGLASMEVRKLRDRFPEVSGLVVRHSFSFKVAGGGIRADFSVASECFSVWPLLKEDTSSPLSGAPLYRVDRGPGGQAVAKVDGTLAWQAGALEKFPSFALLDTRAPEVSHSLLTGEQGLFVNTARPGGLFMPVLCDTMSRIGVYHFASDRMRGPGSPTPNPTLSSVGDNLPALVDRLQRKQKREWESILNAMRDIMPGLEDILVQILPTKTLGLFFTEKGFGRPWRVDEMSDGTIHALSILVAAADPRVCALVIEEPENSVHPWIVRELGKRLRALAEKMTVIVTTHSPVFVDLVLPSEAWVVSRRTGVTSIRRLTDLDPRVEREWNEGNVGLSEYLDAGMLPQALPEGGH